MSKVFVSGSITIKNLDPVFKDRLRNVSARGMHILVGDAAGADTAIQAELANANIDNVTIFCSGEAPRNNVGSWKVQTVSTTALPGTRDFFSAKDRKMAESADYGLMVWDKKSTGTLNNVFNLIENNRSCLIFLQKDKQFVTITNFSDIEKLVSIMSPGAKEQAERKIGLSKRLGRFTKQQHELPF